MTCMAMGDHTFNSHRHTPDGPSSHCTHAPHRHSPPTPSRSRALTLTTWPAKLAVKLALPAGHAHVLGGGSTPSTACNDGTGQDAGLHGPLIMQELEGGLEQRAKHRLPSGRHRALRPTQSRPAKAS